VAGFGVIFGADVFGVDDEPPEEGPAIRSHISFAWSATDFSGLDDLVADEPEEADGFRTSDSRSETSSNPSSTSSDEKRDDADEPDLAGAADRPVESG
jgi:hypothetical protein